MERIKLSLYLRLCLLLISITGISMANNTYVPVHYQMNFRVNNMGCQAHLNGVYLIDTMDLMEGVPKSLSFTQPISNFIDISQNILTVKVDNLAGMVDDSMEKGYCDLDIVAMVKNQHTGEVESKEISHIRYTYVENEEATDHYDRWVLSKKESRVDQAEELGTFWIGVEKAPSLSDGTGEIRREIATREFTVHHSQPFSWIHQSTPFDNTPENKQKLWDKYQEIKSALERKSRRDIRKLVEPGNTDIAKHQGEDPEQHFAIIFD